MNVPAPAGKSLWIFFLLVFILSVPFWLIGAMSSGFLQERIPINLPVSALMFVSPAIAASVLAYRESGSGGVRKLLQRSVDYRRIERKIWYIPMFLLWPAMMVVAYGLMLVLGVPLPDPQIPILMLPVLFVAFFASAVGEEVGWQGYAIDRLQARSTALEASITVGIVWAIWHIVPFGQIPQPPIWIVWQCIGMIPSRILIVWLYNNTGKSVFAAVVFHATSNVSQFLFPNFGSHYDPFITTVILTLIAAIVAFLWGPGTLARYRYARFSGPNARR